MIACAPPVGEAGSLAFSSSLTNQIFDVVISPAALVPASGPPGSAGITLPDGQVVNINAFQPFVFLSSGTLASANMVLPGGGFPGAVGSAINLGFAIPAPGIVSTQAFVLNPASLTGLSLSQASQINITALPAQVLGPTGDDGVVAVDLTTACGGLAPGMAFYGSMYSSLFVSANGRVTFGAGSGDFTATVGEAMTGPPFVGFWCDQSPNSGGSINVTPVSPGVFSVNWIGVPFFGELAATNTYSLRFDSMTGDVFIDNIQGIAINPLSVNDASDPQFLGISPGAAGIASDPGNQNFTPGGAGGAGVVTDMLYQYYDSVVTPGGQTPARAAGVTSIQFSPSGFNYGWFAN